MDFFIVNSTGNITYIYDATGAKLKKIATTTNGEIFTEYSGNYVYKNSNLEFLSQSSSRKMWGYLSAVFARGAKQGDEVLTVFGRHWETGLHTLPTNSKAAWKTVDFPILKSNGIPYKSILTH